MEGLLEVNLFGEYNDKIWRKEMKNKTISNFG